MEIIIFIVGFLFGAGLVFAIFTLIQKNAKSSTDELQNQMQLQFENLANRVFKESSEDFSSQNKEKLEEFFGKFKEKIEDFQKRAETNFKEESENFTKFDMNIKSFIEAGSKISHETNSLVNVMKSNNQKQGLWGEIVLERVLEASGLRKDEEFVLQKMVDGKKPDATIFLPENRCVYIDAKTSYASWESYANANTDEEREVHLKSFRESTKIHIKGLVERDYSANEKSPDYVLMFIPIESCYSLLFSDDGQMWDYAWKNKIYPVSPSTLLAALKIINTFHAVNRQNKNALEISKVCTEMISKIIGMTEDIAKARKNLISAFARLSGHGNILTKIYKIQELGVNIEKSIPELEDDVLEEIAQSEV